MSTDPSRDLIDKLAADLEPVRPIAPLTVTLATILAAAAVVAFVVFSVYGLKPDLVADFMRNTPYAGVLMGLAAAVLGGGAATLASVVPGRQVVLLGGVGLAVAGMLLGIGVTAAATPWSEAGLSGPLMGHLACIVRGTVFAVVPAAVALFAAARGWSARPEVTVALALFGAGSIGALLVHMTCPAVDPLHLLCTHISTPILVTLLLTAVFVSPMRRWAR